MVTTSDPISIEVREVTDPQELTKAHAQHERFERNAAWLQAHLPEVYARHRSKFICVASGEVFVADTAEAAIAQAEAAYPNDDGRFTRYIPKDRIARIYNSGIHG